MDQKDNFSKWMKAVEEALSTEFIVATEPEQGNCNCGAWDCKSCFPDQYSDQETTGEYGGEIHTTPADRETDSELEIGMNDIDFDMQELEEVGMMDEEEEEFIEKGRSGKGVKLGDIVQKTEFRKTGGTKSPMTYGDENLDEEEYDDVDIDLGDGGTGDENLDIDLDQPAEPGSVDIDVDFENDGTDLASVISYMQDAGLSNGSRHYSVDELHRMPPDQLRKIHSEVTGTVDEASKPTKTKTEYDPLDDLDDILNPKDSHLPANIDEPAGFDDEDDLEGDDTTMDLPTASADQTRNALRGMTPSDTMRDYMSRINPDAGAGEPEIPDTPANDVVIRTAHDVPAVISHAMRTTGFVTPTWHNISNLPGYNSRNIRGMGRQVFGMFTNTPLEQIKTIANVGGQGPNTANEVNAVAAWLRDHAEDLGEVHLDHGMAIPGYAPDVKEYRINGVRFHVVRDPMGQYIYAYPDRDARIGGPGGQQQGQIGGRGNMPRLNENKEFAEMLKPTLFERLQWDEEIKQAIDEAFGKPTSAERKQRSQAGYEKRKSEYDAKSAAGQLGPDDKEPTAPKEKSQLARRVGSQPGGRNLIKWMHARHRLDNEAELEPVRFNAEVLWSLFKSHPDDFVIVSATDGVAGIRPDPAHIERRKAEKAAKGETYNPGGDQTMPYKIIAFKDNGEQIDPALLQAPVKPGKEDQRNTDPTVTKARMGKLTGPDMQNPDNTFALLQDQIGELKTIWMAGWSGYRAKGGREDDKAFATGAVPREKMAKRAAMKVDPGVADPLDAVFRRVRPVLKTLGAQANSMIMRRAQRYIGAGNYDAATKLGEAGKKLQQFLATIDTSGDVDINSNPTFARQLKKAIADAAGAPAGSDAYNDFLQSVAKGNVMSLKPVLDALRDNLVALV